MTFPWFFLFSLTFPWPLFNSMTFPGFSEEWPPWTMSVSCHVSLIVSQCHTTTTTNRHCQSQSATYDDFQTLSVTGTWQLTDSAEYSPMCTVMTHLKPVKATTSTASVSSSWSWWKTTIIIHSTTKTTSSTCTTATVSSCVPCHNITHRHTHTQTRINDYTTRTHSDRMIRTKCS